MDLSPNIWKGDISPYLSRHDLLNLGKACDFFENIYRNVEPCKFFVCIAPWYRNRETFKKFTEEYDLPVTNLGWAQFYIEGHQNLIDVLSCIPGEVDITIYSNCSDGGHRFPPNPAGFDDYGQIILPNYSLAKNYQWPGFKTR